MLASALLHAFLLLAWVRPAPEFERAARPGVDPDLPAGGGGLRALRVSMPRRIEIPPPPRPVLAVDMPEIQVRETEIEVASELLPVGAPAPSPGRGAGFGPGDEGAGGGEGDGYVSPVPRSVVPHWDPPSAVRGMEVTVRVFVDATGRPGLVELDPPTPDEGFNRDIMRQVRAWEYRPALRHGTPVDGWAEITFIF
ncbi:energy transducer TonB [Candidatus Palauibacter soopunensis]|uniref:energy transducer TonB family protein n=1 Tax=Candidatus Palauibacter soopunensis TaxID=3056739 RepID=UPI002388D632|nr:energy transducer TonB [Candidatus Palauibacter soopunensis]MDE2879146.1 energy transducer TonB [Candidatus Palauibacter soopunensis]